MPIVFIHGVTVRRERYYDLLTQVRQELGSRRSELQVEGAYWGDLGSALTFGGASIPGFRKAGARSALDAGSADEVELVSVLIEDPLVELESLRHVQASPKGAAQALAKVPEKVDARNARLRGVKQQVADDIADAREAFLFATDALEPLSIAELVGQALETATLADYELTLRELVDPLTRAITAGLAARTRGALELDSDFAWIPAEEQVRQILVARLKAEGERGFIKKQAAVVATFALRRGLRRRVMEAQSLFIGDVLRYMSHRAEVLELVGKAVDAACDLHGEEELWLVGHSLGGIIAFEYCQGAHRDVARLLTVGSQVGLLAELGALHPGAPGKSTKLHGPPRTTLWRNIYDPDDMLSFLCEPIFEFVEDALVNTGAPFPLSHSAYWYSSAVYDELVRG